MKRFLITIVFVLFVGVVAVGFYRGWLILSSRSPDPGSNKVDVSLTVDRDKIQDDVETVKKKTTELTGPVTEPAPVSADTAPPIR